MTRNSMVRRTIAAVSTLFLAAGLAVTLPGIAAAADDDVEIQIIGTNDFHGRLEADGRGVPGADVFAGAVDQLRAENPNTIFAAAGDLIGASTFESFVDGDLPTIKALNAAGLDVSSVGNHEFDQGYADLINRVVPAADWTYLSANVTPEKGSSLPALDKSWVKTIDGVKVGFVGAVTEHLPSLVTPTGIAGLDIKNIAKSVNAEADKLKADGADIIILLVHEGYPSSDCSAVVNAKNDFSVVVNALNDTIDAVISGHTHLAYNCSVPVKAWADDGRAVTSRPVVSAGQYGTHLDQLIFTVNADKEITKISSQTLKLTDGDNDNAPNYPADPAVTAIVDAAVANADVLGAKPLGKIAAGYYRAQLADGTDTRGGESALGNLVAEAQRWAMEGENFGAAEIAMMNPGGLRTDMIGLNDNGYPATLTYKQAANVQPFANTLINRQYTGAQIKQVLEEQWQPEGESRPFLRLGLSKGFTYTYDPDAADGDHITGMWLDGKPIALDKKYSVTVNSFLAAGGDNFTTLAEGTDEKQAAMTDLEGMVAYMATFGSDKPLPADDSQRSVGVIMPDGAPASYSAGDTVKFTLTSLTFPAGVDADWVRDDSVQIMLGDVSLGTFAVSDLTTEGQYDETGVAHVSFTLPGAIDEGSVLTVVGDATGTSIPLPITVKASEMLPATGVATADLMGLALLLLFAGAGALVLARRRDEVLMRG